MQDVKQFKIGVTGLGLIGGSILKALKDKGFYTIAVSQSSYKKAKDFADVSSNNYEVLSDADIIFVCSKMSDTLSVLKKLSNIVSSSAIVVDTCSLKSFVCSGDYPYKFIGSHPMAGTEFSGFENSFKELFEGAKWILSEHNEILEAVIKQTGAKPIIMNPEQHDMSVCKISHLPMLLSVALFQTADDASKKLASSGFRDTTRLAMTNPDLAYDMLNLNKENLNICIDEFIKNLNEIKNMNEEDFKKLSGVIVKERYSMYDKNGKNAI